MKLKQTFTLLAFTAVITLSVQKASAQAGTWKLAGNNLAGTEKLGSLNNFPLTFITDNKTRMTLTGNGRLGIGNTAPANAGLVVDTKVGNTNAIFGSNTTGLSIVSNFPSIGFNAFFNGAWKNLQSGFASRLFFDPVGGGFELASSPASQAAGTNTVLVSRLNITSNGNVGLGTASPLARLDLGDPVDNGAILLQKSGANLAINFTKSSATSNTGTLFVNNAGSGDAVIGESNNGNGIFGQTLSASKFAGFFNGSVFTTGTYQGSDEKLKENIRDFSSAVNIINELHPKLYQFKKDGNYASMRLPQGDHYGLIAQDVEKVLPNLVKETKFDTRIAKNTQTEKPSPADEVNFKALNYTELIPILIKAVQELSQQNAGLQKQMNEIKATHVTSMQSSNAISLTDAMLEQNAPNPFNHATSINYSLPQSRQSGTNAQIIITNQNGNIVKQINISGAGKGVVNVDASMLSSGTYSYAMIVNGKRIGSKQMILVK